MFIEKILKGAERDGHEAVKKPRARATRSKHFVYLSLAVLTLAVFFSQQVFFARKVEHSKKSIAVVERSTYEQVKVSTEQYEEKVAEKKRQVEDAAAKQKEEATRAAANNPDPEALATYGGYADGSIPVSIKSSESLDRHSVCPTELCPGYFAYDSTLVFAPGSLILEFAGGDRHSGQVTVSARSGTSIGTPVVETSLAGVQIEPVVTINGAQYSASQTIKILSFGDDYSVGTVQIHAFGLDGRSYGGTFSIQK
jgi:hypothetical protein